MKFKFMLGFLLYLIPFTLAQENKDIFTSLSDLISQKPMEVLIIAIVFLIIGYLLGRSGRGSYKGDKPKKIETKYYH